MANERIRRFSCTLCLLAWALAGCHEAKMPSPVVFHDGRVNPCARIPESERTTKVQLFYATSRGATGKPDDPKYSNAMTNDLHVGQATIQLGGDDMTWEQLCAVSTGQEKIEELPVSVVGMREVAELSKPSVDGYTADELAWADAINRQLDRTQNKQVNIYVPGCNTDLNVDLEMAGPFFHFAGRRGAIVVFSWPCRQSIMYYSSDSARSRESAPHLIHLIQFLGQNTKAEKINILAYSAGGQCLDRALIDLRESYPDWDEAKLQRELKLGTVVFAGSELDLKGFATDDLTRFIDLPSEITVYISKQDSSLKLASGLFGAPRVGNPTKKVLTREDLDRLAHIEKLQIIDVTNVPGSHTSNGLMGHGYWYANEWVMSDILAIFWGASPQQRGLEEMPRGEWVFPDDYPQRITQAIAEQAAKGPGSAATTTTSSTR